MTTRDEIVAQREIDGVLTDLTQEMLDEYEADPAAFTMKVIEDRAVLDMEAPGTEEDAQRLIDEREVEEEPFDPTDFGDELIPKPPKASE